MAWPVKLGLGLGLVLPGLLAAGAEVRAGDQGWTSPAAVVIGEPTCFSVNTTVQGTCDDGGCESGTQNRVIKKAILKLVPGEDCARENSPWVTIEQGKLFISPISGQLCFQDSRELRALLEPAVSDALKGECSDVNLKSVEEVVLTEVSCG